MTGPIETAAEGAAGVTIEVTARGRSHARLAAKGAQKISVVVPTYNRASYLRRTLDSFFEQECLTGVDHELLVVDNNSSEETSQVLRSFDGNETLRCVVEPQQGLCHARNRGVKESRGSVVAFLDDDVIVDGQWLRHLDDCFRDTGADVVGGRSYLIYEDELPRWFGPAFRKALSEVNLGTRRRTLKDGDNLFGLNIAFRKSKLVESGGFDGKLDRKGKMLLGGGETELLRRMAASGATIVYEPRAVVGHIIGPERLRWDYFERRAAGSGSTLAILDSPAGIAVRLARSLRTSAALGVAATRVATNSPFGPYPRKLATYRFLAAKAHCLGRWQRLGPQESLVNLGSRLHTRVVGTANRPEHEAGRVSGTVRATGSLRVLIGTLYSGENEFDRCIASVRAQTYDKYEHLIIEHLPEHEAHQKLYGEFMRQQDRFDLFLKLDADMVLVDQEKLGAVVDLFQHDRTLDHAVFRVTDWMSQSDIIGIHAFSNRAQWHIHSDVLFPDLPPRVPGRRGYYLSRPPSPLAMHSPDPSQLQAFHFGFHRAMKAYQVGQEVRLPHAIGQWRQLKRLWKHFEATRERRLALALIAVEHVLTEGAAASDAHYTNPRFGEMFAQDASLSSQEIYERLAPKWNSAIQREYRWARTLLPGLLRSIRP